MEILIKQIKENGNVIFPLTSVESVLLKNGSEVITLDKELNKKIERVTVSENSGLIVTLNNNLVIISHENNITPNDSTQALRILYDNNGHIVSSEPLSKIQIITADGGTIEYNGSEDKQINLSDDFKLSENKINLNWNNT